MMGVSSNFGNMFSAAGGSIFLAFLPMLPIQILLNNLLYDTSQTVMTTDNVDAEYIVRPKRWDISFIRRFMVTIGPVSSLFDFATFFTMIFIFGIPFGLSASGVPLATPFQQGQFQTAWFVESLCSQTLVVLIIRTRKVPFYKSKPSKYLVLMLLSVISFALIMPYTPVGAFFGFVPPPPAFYLALAGILGAYALLAEIVKKWFYKRNANLLEQIRVVKVRTVFSDRSVRFMQDVIAVISLNPEEEFTIESLTADLNSAINYPINQNQLVRNLQYLRHNGLISVDWNKRMIKREKTLQEYVKTKIISGPTWADTNEDWRKINAVLLNKWGKVNSEYQKLLTGQ
jgi:hypothetical protein